MKNQKNTIFANPRFAQNRCVFFKNRLFLRFSVLLVYISSVQYNKK